MCAPPFLAGALAQATVYGKKLLQVDEVPADVLIKYGLHDADMKAKGTKPGLMTSGSVDWAAPRLSAPSAGNPYRVVVRVSGQVIADGDAGVNLMTGWSDEGQSRLGPASGAFKERAKAGERLELVGASAPLSFKEDRNLQPSLSYLGNTNFRIESVKLEVWSGLGKSSFVQRFWAWTPLLLGVVFLVVVLVMRRR